MFPTPDLRVWVEKWAQSRMSLPRKGSKDLACNTVQQYL